MSRHSDRVEELLAGILGELEELNAALPDEPDAEEPDEPEDDPECGVNGCGRTVDSADATCWQHPQED